MENRARGAYSCSCNDEEITELAKKYSMRRRRSIMASVRIVVIVWNRLKVCAGSYDHAQVECVGTPSSILRILCSSILMYYLDQSGYNGYKLNTSGILPPHD